MNKKTRSIESTYCARRHGAFSAAVFSAVLLLAEVGCSKKAPIAAALPPAPGSPASQGATAAPAAPASLPGSLPPEAIANLREGTDTTFENGQVWTIKNGNPIRLK